MASIQVLDLRSAGSDLLMDSEGFLNELGNDELDSINGGLTPIAIWGIAVTSQYVIGAMASGAVVSVVGTITINLR
jgi:lactobin A/cerein 7B family class IIb bacteriocin